MHDVGLVDDRAWPSVSIVVRAYNERPALERLWPLLGRQDYPGEVDIVLVDSESTDGTHEMAFPANLRRIVIEKASFTWGRALNLGCRATKGDVLVLLSAHCFPMHDRWLRALVAPLREEGIGLSYGRQVGSVEVNAREAAELEIDYPEHDTRGGTSFSNANGAVPRAIFEQHPFDEEIQIGEEIPLVRAVTSAGLVIAYAADASVEHAHPCSLAGEYRRWFWNGYTREKFLYVDKRKAIGPLMLVARFGMALMKSWSFLARRGAWGWMARAPELEWSRMLALHRGFRAARTEREGGPSLEDQRYGDLVVPDWVQKRTQRGRAG